MDVHAAHAEEVRGELAHRMARMRRKFVGRYGFVVPEVRISDDFAVSDKAYVINAFKGHAPADDWSAIYMAFFAKWLSTAKAK